MFKIINLDRDFENVALSSAGASCSSESKYESFECTKAIDGKRTTAWISDRFLARDKPWIQVNLRTVMLIYRIDLYYSSYFPIRVGGVILEFADGSQQSVSLEYRFYNCFGQRCLISI